MVQGQDDVGSGGSASVEAALTTFFADLRSRSGLSIPNQGLAELVEYFPLFMNELRNCPFIMAEAQSQRLEGEAPEALARWFGALETPLKAVEDAGLFGNPWEAAGLRRDEVRCARVLAWFLDPRGGHGSGDMLLTWLLGRIGFPCQHSRYCTVRVESRPDGSNASRVDIEVDDPGFFLVIEVKIDAPEQPEQIERYCLVAEAKVKASGRPWAIVFLTPQGTPPKTAGDRIERVVPIAWSHVAASLRRKGAMVGASAAAPRFLATTFADHIIKF